MLNLSAKCKIVQSQEFPVAAGVVIPAEGLALIQTFEGGVEKVTLSAGGGNEVFMGVSYGEVFTPAVKSNVETLIVPAAGAVAVTLLHAVLTNTQCFAYDNTSSAALTIGNPANALEYSVVGTLLTFNVARAGHSVTITYRYAPTAAELMATDNVRITSFSATDYIGSIGVIQEGEVYTDQFDASKDWASATGVETGNSGVFDVNGGAGTLIAGAVITHVPDANYPYLGFRF